MHKYFLGIDLGTGSTKAVAVDEQGRALSTAQNHYPTRQPKPGYSEQDPQLIWQAVVACVEQVVKELNGPPAAISFSSAMHSIMPVNEAGEPLMNAMLWADARSGDIAQQLRSNAEGEDIYRHTGTAIYAMSPLCKIMWLKDNEPELYRRAYKFISIKEYIWFKLFGLYEVDYSIASSTGLFNVMALQWYPKSLALAGINASKLSEPVDTNHRRKLATDSIKGIGADTLFFIGASDGCCANLGGNAIKLGVGALTIGTSGAVRVGSTKPVYNYQAMTFNYLLNAKTFICGGAVNNGGGAVNWLLKNFLNQASLTDDSYQQLFARIDTIEPGSEGLMFLPYLFAERAPVWDAKSSASFINITSKHMQAHFLRAALEGICFALNHVLTAVEQTDRPVHELVISGGFIASATWVQMLANVTGKRLVLLQSDDASAIGAIYLAMEAMGVDVDAVMNKEAAERTVIDPDAKIHQHYKKLFAVYKELYGAIKASVHQLHDLGNL